MVNNKILDFFYNLGLAEKVNAENYRHGSFYNKHVRIHSCHFMKFSCPKCGKKIFMILQRIFKLIRMVGNKNLGNSDLIVIIL